MVMPVCFEPSTRAVSAPSAKFVVGIACAVSHGVSRPAATVQIHERQQHGGIHAAAQKQTHRHIADQLTPHCRLVDREQFFPSFAGRLRRQKGLGLKLIPPAQFILPILNRQLGSRGELVECP